VHSGSRTGPSARPLDPEAVGEAGATFTADRDRPGTYVQIVEFPSYQEAMANSGLPETGEFAEKLARLCDGQPAFRNLDVRRVDEFS
jgi:hypothetical protein